MSKLETLLQQERLYSWDEEFIILVYKDVEGFLNEKPDHCVLIFPPLNNRRRYFIHKVGELFNVQTFSVGEGVRRLTVVCASKKIEKKVDDENRVMDTTEPKKGAVSKSKRARPDKPIYIPPAQRRAQKTLPDKDEKTQQSSKSVLGQKNNKKPVVCNKSETAQKPVLVKPEPSTSQLISDKDKDIKLKNSTPDNVNTSMNAEYLIVPESHVINPTFTDIVPSNSHENSKKNIESQKIIFENQTKLIEKRDIENQKNISDDIILHEFSEMTIEHKIVEIKLTKDIVKSNAINEYIEDKDGNDEPVKEDNEGFNNGTNNKDVIIESMNNNDVVMIESIAFNTDFNNGSDNKSRKDFKNKADNKNNKDNKDVVIMESIEHTKYVINGTDYKDNNTETNNKDVFIKSIADAKDNNRTNNKDVVIESIADKDVSNETDSKENKDNRDVNNGLDKKEPWENKNDINKDNDQEEEELLRASEEINRKNKRIIKQTFNNSDILIISKDDKPIENNSPKSNNTNSNSQSKEKEAIVDSWEDLLDGGKLETDLMLEIIDQVGNVKISPAKEDYSEYKQKTSLEGDHAHVLEIYDFPKEFATRDLVSIIDSHYNKGNYHIKWVDDNHALGIFASGFVATEILNISHPMIKLRPMTEASKQSISKAIRYPNAMMPSAVRPQTCPHAARRMVTGALGLKLTNAKEERAKEIKILKEAREKKRRSAKQQDDAWEGNLNSSLE